MNEGTYKFVIYDSYEDVITDSSYDDVLSDLNTGYVIYIDNEIVKEGGGDDGFKVSEEFSFVINAPSSHPTVFDIATDVPSD